MGTWVKPTVESFAVDFAEGSPSDSTSDVYRLLPARISHESLKILYVKGKIEDPCPAHPGDLFRPLFYFTNLVSLKIFMSCGPDVDDGTILDMARAWPHLEELHLESHQQWPMAPPRTTLLALHAFSQHCRSLRRLDLSFDTVVVPRLPPPSDVAGARS
ncbi:hypothetical protein DFH09DRAFT_1312432 [Mycena vulgaris]|nr:hypothetical protein DFH09DRAFT_1312432 [Mycena vulgaris]